MDDRHFDDLTKLVGRTASRRAVIRAALAGAVASVFGSSIAEAALSPIKTRPRLCIQPGQPCGRPGVDPSRDCCYKCNSATHTCCEDIGYLCTSDSDCCKTVAGVQPICRDTNAKDSDHRKSCQLPGTLIVGAQCVAGSECTSGNCLSGVCVQCPAGKTICGTGCCDPKQCQVCSGGVCKSKCGPCQTCDGNGNCVSTCTKCQTCAGGVCTPKMCGPCQTCNPDTGLCQNSCNSCQVCKNNTCVAKCNACQTCNPATGVCADKSCANKCEVCSLATGVCSPKTCGQCQICNPDTGQCQSTCNKCQVCRNNVCVDAVDCSPFATGCLGKACDPATGLCTIDAPLSGIPCDDLNGCTLNDTCVDGVCVGIPQVCGPCEVCVSDGPTTSHCEEACSNCEVCDSYTGACDPIICDVGLICCDGECIDPLTDAENCNTCGNVCEFSVPCTNGVCCIPDGGFCDQTGNEGCCGGVCCNCSDFSNDFTCASSVDECPFCPE